MTSPRPSARPASPLRRLFLIEPGEGRRVLLAAAWFFLLLASYAVLRPVRDAMGVAGGVGDLPWLWNFTFVTSLLVSPLFAWATARLPRRRFVAGSYRVVALSLVGCLLAWEVADETGRLWIGRAFYVWVSVFNLFVVSVLWSVVTELFPQGAARRTFGAIALGATLGAIVGAATTGLVAVHVGVGGLLLASALLIELGLVCARALMRGNPAADLPVFDGEREVGWLAAMRGARRIARSRYLLAVAAYVALLAFAATVVHFEKSRATRAAFESYEGRTAFFAWVDTGTQVATALLQTFVTGRVMSRFGIGAALCVLPVVALLGAAAMATGTWLATGPLLGWIVAFDVAQNAARHALSRPAREALFTNVDDEARYPAKNFVDTVVHRGSDVASAWTFEGVLRPLLGGAAWAAAMVPALAFVLVGAALGRAARRSAEGAGGSVSERG